MYAVKLFSKDDNVTTIDFESCLSFFAKGNCMNAISKFNVQYDGSQHVINGLMFYMNRLLLVEHLFSNMILEE